MQRHAERKSPNTTIRHGAVWEREHAAHIGALHEYDRTHDEHVRATLLRRLAYDHHLDLPELPVTQRHVTDTTLGVVYIASIRTPPAKKKESNETGRPCGQTGWNDG